jgi:Zn-dependent protease with chaperone function
MASEAHDVVACPECGTDCPVLLDYATWCAACDWNVGPPIVQSRGHVRRRLGRWMDASLLAEVGRGRTHRGFRLATYAFATLVYAVVAGLFLGGLALIVLPFPNIFAIVFGVLMIGTACIAFPRFAKVPPGVVDRARFPALYGLADRVAARLGARPIDGIAINNVFNASYARCGVRGRRIMTLGLPLMSILEPDAMTALIAHELAHDVNHDPMRGRYIRGAYTALLEMHGLIQPGGVIVVGRNMASASVGVSGMMANLAMRALSLVTRPFLYTFEVLVRRDGQAAEYMADALSAEVAGADGARQTLDATHLGSLLDAMAGAAVTRRSDPALLFDEFRRKVAALPDRERERIGRYQELCEASVDSSHPPTAQRRRVIDRRGARAPRVVISGAEWQAIRDELAPLEPRFATALVARARDRLYR